MTRISTPTTIKMGMLDFTTQLTLALILGQALQQVQLAV
jgi:hypothetical protein